MVPIMLPGREVLLAWEGGAATLGEEIARLLRAAVRLRGKGNKRRTGNPTRAYGPGIPVGEQGGHGGLPPRLQPINPGTPPGQARGPAPTRDIGGQAGGLGTRPGQARGPRP